MKYIKKYYGVIFGIIGFSIGVYYSKSFTETLCFVAIYGFLIYTALYASAYLYYVGAHAALEKLKRKLSNKQ